MNTPTPKEEFEEWLETVIYDNSNILSPSGLAWEAWQASSEQLTAVTEQRDQWKEKYIQQNKDLGYELRDPNGTIWSECKRLQTELKEVTEQRDVIEKKLRIELRGHPDSELWGDAGLIAATMRCVDALDEVTEQRDRLAEALVRIANNDVQDLPETDYAYELGRMEGIAKIDLQSLTPNA